MSELRLKGVDTGLEGGDRILLAETLAADFATRAATHDREGSFPFENFVALRDANLLNLTIPREFGGLGAGFFTTCQAIEKIATGDAATALVLTMHYLQHAKAARHRQWPTKVYEQLCRESVAGIALINAARVEPELGTPARGGLPATTAQKTPEGWLLKGRKQYTTGSPILRYFVVWAKTADEAEVGSFLVPRDIPGVRIEETWDHLGMRATGSHDLILENASIPLDYALDVRSVNVKPSPDPLDLAANCLFLCALYQGVATAARDWLIGYLHSRSPSNLGASLATLPHFQTAIGEIEALLYANRRLIEGLAIEIDRGQYDASVGSQAQTVKYLTTNQAIRAVESALKLIGNPGLSKHHPLERHYRDILCSRIHTPQDDAICLSLGKSALAIR